MPLTRSAIHRLHLEQSASPAPVSTTTSAPLDESISSTLVSDDRTPGPDPSTSSASSSSSDGDSDSSDDDSDDDDDDAPAADPTAHLSALLARAKDAARARDAHLKAAHDKRRGAAGDGLAGNDELVLFADDGDDDDDESGSDGERQRRDRDDSSTPRASTSRALPPSLARPLSRSHPLLSSLPTRRTAPSSAATSAGVRAHVQARSGGISLAQDVGGALSDVGATRVVRKGAVVVDGEGRGKGKAREVEDRWGQAPLPQLSKKQLKAKQPHTAGAAWFDMPATPMTPQLKRELDALRLSAALDPKRFLRGGAKRDKVGEFFQVGHVVAPSTRATTQSTAPRVHKRGFVEELVESEEAQAYARKKTKEVLAKTMSGRKRQRKGYKGSAGNGGARK